MIQKVWLAIKKQRTAPTSNDAFANYRQSYSAFLELHASFLTTPAPRTFARTTCLGSAHSAPTAKTTTLKVCLTQRIFNWQY